jgi:hypothetical protein
MFILHIYILYIYIELHLEEVQEKVNAYVSQITSYEFEIEKYSDIKNLFHNIDNNINISNITYNELYTLYNKFKNITHSEISIQTENTNETEVSSNPVLELEVEYLKYEVASLEHQLHNSYENNEQLNSKIKEFESLNIELNDKYIHNTTLLEQVYIFINIYISLLCI